MRLGATPFLARLPFSRCAGELPRADAGVPGDRGVLRGLRRGCGSGCACNVVSDRIGREYRVNQGVQQNRWCAVRPELTRRRVRVVRGERGGEQQQPVSDPVRLIFYKRL